MQIILFEIVPEEKTVNLFQNINSNNRNNNLTMSNSLVVGQEPCSRRVPGFTLSTSLS